ncbi:hypothetical protein [Planctobacterium marinum]|uniref:Uncharacterized protein n=1 Tax=Planctobacterium marinum TaxID=1631968 RepID=A0AA48HTD6_9ALTE|nr:hypothetical protein MACH26_38730 [Planctobacterium marinum]
MDHFNISKTMINTWLWMLDESQDERLAQQARGLLLKLFPSIQAARSFSGQAK